MLKIYAANIKNGEYGENMLTLMSKTRADKYNRLKSKTDKMHCSAVAFLLNKACPEKTEFYDKNGKPCIEDGYISISHSGDWALLAVSDKPVGIDIEKIRPIDTKRLIKKFFCESEINCAEDVGLEEFFDLWTRKESMLKVNGEGLSGLKQTTADRSFLTVSGFEGYCVSVCTDYKEFSLHII